MDALKSAVLSVCILSAGIWAVRELTAVSVLRKRMELILKMVFVIVLLTPFVKGGFEVQLPELSDRELLENNCSREAYKSALAEQTADNISQVLQQQIQASGIKCSKVSVDVNISDDGSIIITKVTVNADNFEKSAEIIKGCLGNETEVVYGYTE